jgi:hypothetical protein
MFEKFDAQKRIAVAVACGEMTADAAREAFVKLGMSKADAAYIVKDCLSARRRRA